MHHGRALFILARPEKGGAMNEFEQLGEMASYAVAIFGNPARGDFALYDLTPGTSFPVEDMQHEIAERAFCFCGVIGVVHGLPCTALAEPLDEHTIRALSHAFTARIEAAVTAVEAALAQPKDDSEAWCFRLYALKDPRG
jgi:hypothetical protein